MLTWYLDNLRTIGILDWLEWIAYPLAHGVVVILPF